MKRTKLNFNVSSLISHLSSREGFTLIELLIVIVIIGVLATVFMSNYSGVRQRARDSQRKADLRQIQVALQLYSYDQGIYPASLSGCLGNLTFGSATYMQKIPCDPLASATYYNNGNYYYTAPGGTGYTLCACLENTNDNQGAANSTCGILASSAPVISSPPPRLGLFSNLASLIPKFGGGGSLLRQVSAQVVSSFTNSPGSIVTEDCPTGGVTDWINPLNAQTNDNINYATITVQRNFMGDCLRATNFGFTIPDGSTIGGILVEVDKKVDSSSFTRDEFVEIIKNGIPGTQRYNLNEWPVVDTYVSYGGTADLWGMAWTPADINSPTFGFGISPRVDFLGGPRTFSIDHIKITVYYTPPIPTLTPAPPNVTCSGKFFVLESQ